MKILMNIYSLIINWLNFIFTGKKRYKTIIVDDPPNNIKSQAIYIVGAKNFYWCVMMKCPCGCNDFIHLNLVPKGRPIWSFKIHKNRSVSLHPSVWRTKGCKSHFFIKKGIIEWCK